jgi:hypothetical protein
MEKSLYQAPQGIQSLEDAPDIEIEIEDPESVHISMDGLEIDIENEEEGFDDNLAEYLDDDVIQSIVVHVPNACDTSAVIRTWQRSRCKGLCRCRSKSCYRKS